MIMASEQAIQPERDKLDLWLTDCIKDIQDQILSKLNDHNPSAFRGMGNSMVSCMAHKTDEENYQMTVVIARDYSSFVIGDFQPHKEVEFVPIKNSLS